MLRLINSDPMARNNCSFYSGNELNVIEELWTKDKLVKLVISNSWLSESS